LDLDNPRTYNEKLQWLKLYYRNPILPKLVDKFEYKSFVSARVGQEYVVKNYGIWNSVDEIEFDGLPAQFVLKTTHDQGGVVICKDKMHFNILAAKRKLRGHLKRNLYYLFREWPYREVIPRIIAEELLVEADGADLKDYKFYCFNGEPRIMYIATGRQSGGACFDFFDMDFKHLDIRRPKYGQLGDVFERPENWCDMISLARKMSEGLPHVRIDFYNVGGKIFFGEFTLFQGGGFMPFSPETWDYELGSYLRLPVEDESC
jgi:hypothetical protein